MESEPLSNFEISGSIEKTDVDITRVYYCVSFLLCLSYLDSTTIEDPGYVEGCRKPLHMYTAKSGNVSEMGRP